MMLWPESVGGLKNTECKWRNFLAMGLSVGGGANEEVIVQVITLKYFQREPARNVST